MYIKLFVLVTCFQWSSGSIHISHLVFLLPVFKGVELDLCITMLHLVFKGSFCACKLYMFHIFSTLV